MEQIRRLSLDMTSEREMSFAILHRRRKNQVLIVTAYSCFGSYYVTRMVTQAYG